MRVRLIIDMRLCPGLRLIPFIPLRCRDMNIRIFSMNVCVFLCAYCRFVSVFFRARFSLIRLFRRPVFCFNIFKLRKFCFDLIKSLADLRHRFVNASPERFKIINIILRNRHDVLIFKSFLNVEGKKDRRKRLTIRIIKLDFGLNLAVMLEFFVRQHIFCFPVYLVRQRQAAFIKRVIRIQKDNFGVYGRKGQWNAVFCKRKGQLCAARILGEKLDIG
ncbi:hypothetical protein B4123_4474 [Bacillus paralicheniformis]|nr:hypothetical protein B4123_4474 [Bacillus paralicheniformis]TWJ41709.1 hypothetical protein CHCC5025_0923 [Bacillus licheniformis]